MITRATAIPLAIYPYSTSSRIVHWLTRHQGRISTVLKGAVRPKSPFLGEYALFSTSELLYFNKRSSSLYSAKECALLQQRNRFRTDWRAMQTASYLTALVYRTTPDEIPAPELFDFYEELLDLSEEYGRSSQFILWAELQFCSFHGHAPNLKRCTRCGADQELKFCASQGGLVCMACTREKKLPVLDCPPDVLSILRAWQAAQHPDTVIHTALNGAQQTALHHIAAAFILYHFNIQPHHRYAALQAA